MWQKMGIDSPTAGEKMDAAISRGDWTEAGARSFGALDYWARPGESNVFGIIEDKLGGLGEALTGLIDPIQGVSKVVEGLAGDSNGFTDIFKKIWGGISGMFGGGGGFDFGSIFSFVKHAGGRVHGTGPMRAIPAWMIANAPRLHNGLAPDEFPAILQLGETVIPRAGAVRERPMEIHVHMGGGDNNLTRQSLNQLQAAIGSSISRAVRRNA